MRKWFFLSSTQLCDWLEYVIIELDYKIWWPKLILFSLFSREPRMNLESKWPMTVLEDYSNNLKCLRHYMLQIVMQLHRFFALFLVVILTSFPHTCLIPYPTQWHESHFEVAFLCWYDFTRYFLCVQLSRVPVNQIEYKSKCPLGIIR